MSVAKITMIGQETWLSQKNESLFDLMNLPENISKDNVVDNIILECGEFETLYSDPEFMRTAIGSWSNKYYWTFKKWADALEIEYNPLENYDRFETWTDTGNEKASSEFKDDTKTTNDGKTDSDGGSSQDGYTEDLVSAYDSDNYQESEKHEINTSEEHDDHVTNSNTLQNNTTQTTEGTKDNENKHDGRIHGNIGVTTSQQMLQSELDIARFNIINEITNLFMIELCICVYE